MGASSHQRENTFEGQGLVSGLTFHLEFALSEGHEPWRRRRSTGRGELAVLAAIQPHRVAARRPAMTSARGNGHAQ